MAGAGGRGAGHGWPGAGKDSGHPQHPHACRDEKVEAGYAAAWGRRMRDNGHQLKYEGYRLDLRKIFAIMRTVK